MLSFPRDLYVPIPGVGTDKINAAYSYGPAKTIQTVSALTGEDINYYVIVNFTAFRSWSTTSGASSSTSTAATTTRTSGRRPRTTPNIDLQPGYQS